jgi:hypothetical protein
MCGQLLRLGWVHPLVAVILCGQPLAAPSRGELITVKFAGTVTDVRVDYHPQLQDVDFPEVGDPITGFYRFDSNVPDSENSPLGGLWYNSLPNTTKAIMVSVGDFQLQGSANGIITFEDYYAVGDREPFRVTSPEEARILIRNNFSLVVLKDNMFSDPNVLPLSPPSLDGALEQYLLVTMHSLRHPGPDDVVILARLDSLIVVPEPSTLGLLGFAFHGFLRTRRSRKHSLLTE